MLSQVDTNGLVNSVKDEVLVIFVVERRKGEKNGSRSSWRERRGETECECVSQPFSGEW